jgi:hypothetical protein
MARASVDTIRSVAQMQASRIALLWLGLASIGSLMYMGLIIADVRRFSWYDLAAIMSVAAAISLLLKIDGKDAGEAKDVASMTFAGLIYVLLTKRRTVLALAVFTAAGSILAAYYFITHGSLIFRAVYENQDTALYRCPSGSSAAREYAVGGGRGA